MEKITSFTIDHNKLQPGVYVSRKDQVEGGMVTTFDLRMTSPNEEPVMNTAEMHTIEHLGATFLRNHGTFGKNAFTSDPWGAGPVSICFWQGITSPRISCPDVECMSLSGIFRGVPGASPKDCGNYLDMNLGMARYLAGKYLEVLYHVDRFPESRLVYPE